MKGYANDVVSDQLADPEISARIFGILDKGLTEYLMFREERYLKKNQKNWGNKTQKKDTSRVSAKKATKKIGEAQN